MFVADAAVTVATYTQYSLMGLFSQACDDFGLIITLKTTNVMGHDTEALPVITIDDYELDVVCQFTHLGSTITDNLSLDAQIDKRIVKAASTLKLSCSSQDSSVGKPRTVGEDQIWQSTMPALPAHCCMTATY